MDAGAIIRDTRTRTGLTQAQLAERAGTSQPVVSAYEHGRRDPALSTLSRLVRAAGAVLEARSRLPRTSDLPPPVDLADHGRRLVDLLLLADAIPYRRRGGLDAPRMDSA